MKAGENPAWEILRGIVGNREKNDKRNLTAYEYDVYTKTEVDIDNITDKFRQKEGDEENRRSPRQHRPDCR